MSSHIIVTDIPRKLSASERKPDHWVDSKPSGFVNPWPSFRKHTFKDFFALLSQSLNFPSPTTDEAARLIPIRKPTWGQDDSDKTVTVKKDKITATWLGHACFLVELPSRSDSNPNGWTRGARILFDPVFSDRCSPSQYIGPKRYTPPPCKIEEIPEVDAVVISHNHYDHLDVHTINTLSKRTPSRIPHFFAPLGNKGFFQSFGIPDSHIHIMDWWDSKRVEIVADDNSGKNDSHSEHPMTHNSNRTVTVDITCTPAQHFTGRSLFDRFKTLWASWVVEEVRSPLPASPSTTTTNMHTTPPADANPASVSTTANTNSPNPGVKIFFGGDTGYRSVPEGQDESTVPTCPAFKEIGDRFGGFDFAMIPIGAYQPRQFMSPIHCAPQDSVRLFKDIRAKRALGMHWGTWVLTKEDVDEPPKKLAEECKLVGIDDGAFGVCGIGETLFF